MRQHMRFLIALALVVFLAAGLLTALLGSSLWEVAWVQAVQGDAGLRLPMQIITFFGDEAFFFLLVPLFFWCVDKALGIDLALLLVTSAFANGLCKGFFKHPRPFWGQPGLRLSDATSFALPSGHSQNAAVLAGYTGWVIVGAGRSRASLGRWISAIALGVAAGLVALSRVYLGVHFPGDVIWGVAVGLGVLAGYILLQTRLRSWLGRLPLWGHILLATAAAGLAFVLNQTALAIPFGSGAAFGELYAEAYSTTLAEAANLAGMILGLGIGLALEARYVRFAVDGPGWKRAVRYLVGMAGLLAIWMGLRVLFPQEPMAVGLALRVVRYGLAFLWAIVVWPWLFVRARL